MSIALPNLRSLRFVTSFLLMLSCGRSLPQINGVDLEAWRKDKNGCNEMRPSMIDTLINQKGKLLSLSEMEIVHLLGRPDQNELYTRNQKFYYYHIDAGENCPQKSAKSARLMIRFNAVGLAQEILVE